MIDFSEKSYSELLSAMLGRVPDDLDKREGSFIRTALGPAALALERFYMELQKVQRQAFALTCVGSDLDYKVAEAGVTRKEATPAVRRGEFNARVPVGTRFATVGENPVNFVVTRQESSETCRLTAETAGLIGNAYAGDLMPIDYVEGLSKARLTDILAPGTDAETDDSLRQRYLELLSQRPFAGNIADYRSNILSIDGVGGVQVYPVWNGPGTVKCSILSAGYGPASPTLVDEVQRLICPKLAEGASAGSPEGHGLAPIGAEVTIGTPEELAIAVDAVVTPAPGFSLSQLEEGISLAVDDCLMRVRKAWDTPATPGSADYPCFVYASQMLAAILSVDGVQNVSQVSLNGGSGDVQLTETGETQQIPIRGQVTVHG